MFPAVYGYLPSISPSPNPPWHKICLTCLNSERLVLREWAFYFFIEFKRIGEFHLILARNTALHHPNERHAYRAASQDVAHAPLVFMFSGQGSQYFQMGGVLFRRDPVFREWMHALDAIVVKVAGYSLTKYLYEDSHHNDDLLEHTRHSHPAIFAVEYALARTLMAHGLNPDSVMGASLGEFTPAASAAVLIALAN